MLRVIIERQIKEGKIQNLIPLPGTRGSRPETDRLYHRRDHGQHGRPLYCRHTEHLARPGQLEGMGNFSGAGKNNRTDSAPPAEKTQSQHLLRVRRR